MIKRSVLWHTAIVFFVGVLSGCQSLPTYHYDQTPPARNESFSLIDMRPVNETQGGQLSFNGFSSDVGKFRIGDEQSLPNRLDYASDRLGKLAGHKLAGKTLKVSHFEIVNDVHEATAENIKFSIFFGGLLGALLHKAVDTECQGFMVVTLELELDNTPYRADIRQPYTFERYQEFTDPFLSPQIKQAMDIALTTIADKINRGEAYDPAPTLAASEKTPQKAYEITSEKPSHEELAENTNETVTEASPNPPTKVAVNTTYSENAPEHSSADHTPNIYSVRGSDDPEEGIRNGRRKWSSMDLEF